MRAWLAALCLAAAPAMAQGPPLVLGVVLPETGLLADLAADMKKALVLWQEQRNAAGGLLGRRVELRTADDRSEASAAGRLYARLVDAEGAQLLIGPFGNAACVVAAAYAERHRRVLVNAAGISRDLHRAGSRYVFQVPAPLADYGAGALAIARAMGYRSLHVVARNDPGSRESAARLVQQARALGLEPGEAQTVAADLRDYAAQVAAARARNAEVWVAFGQPEDAAEMVKSFKRIGYAPWVFLAQGAAEPRFLQFLGQDAEFALGLAAYDTRFATRGNAAFVEAWRQRWQGEPGALAAGAYAAAQVLEEAVRKSGSLDQERLRETLSALDTETPIGRYRVDKSGAQVAAKPAVVQILAGRREVVWPSTLATAQWRLPYPRWDERRAHAAQ
jgi:branched-chain amino acid transport system substrate-binding protein